MPIFIFDHDRGLTDSNRVVQFDSPKCLAGVELADYCTLGVLVSTFLMLEVTRLVLCTQCVTEHNPFHMMGLLECYQLLFISFHDFLIMSAVGTLDY